ncbi:MAG TPA: ATP-binding protein [Sphingomicrobium sp.]|jgi:anti-sigma regulatory factor (Ser/Thr protein kinase)|nr:ATP-binding protein [Sphingomicrobium sp.]
MSESIHDPLRFSLSGPTAVHEATLASKNFSRRARLNEADAARLAIVVEELVTNLYDHGGLGLDDAFEIELSATATNICVVLVDPGTPFDPGLATLNSNSTARGGGAGLRLVRAWATSTDYRSANGLNRLAVLLPR